jgi:hypothetical protein
VDEDGEDGVTEADDDEEEKEEEEEADGSFFIAPARQSSLS